MRLKPSPYISLLLATLLWGATYVLVRSIHDEVPPVALNFWRWVVVVVLLLPFSAAAVWHHRQAVRHHMGLLLVLSAAGVVYYQTAAYLGLQTTTAINAGLILATTPVVIPVISFALDREVVSLRQAAGIVLSMVGVVCVIVRGDVAALGGFQATPGDLWMVSSVLGWALYSVLLKRLGGALPPLPLMTVLGLLGVVLMLPFYAWEFAEAGGFAPSGHAAFALAYLAIGSGIVCYLCWNHAVALIGANRAGLFVHLIPVFTVVLAILVLDERLSGYHVFGAGLIALGLYLTARRPGAAWEWLAGRRRAGSAERGR